MKKFLVIVDMQNDFINGSLGTKEAIEIVPKIVQKIKDFKKENNDKECKNIIITKDTHQSYYLKTQEGRNLPVEHCIKDTKGWNINSEIMNELNDNCTIFEKESFGSIQLSEYLKRIYLDSDDKDFEIELVGLCTDICVISNALILKAFLPEVKITVDSSCCAGVTPESHENALNAMKMCQINII